MLSQIQSMDKYTAIEELHTKEKFSVSLLCKIAGIARSAYYKWLNRTPTAREREYKKIIKVMKALYKQVEGIYGYRRMKLNLNRRFNKHYNHKRIYRLMKVAGLQSVIRRKRKRYIRSTPQHVAENLLQKNLIKNG